jgi:TRAP-type mannitol/chloroaromatic compound transport system permease small subunit
MVTVAAWFVLGFCFFSNLYLVHRKLFDPPPLTFLELFNFVYDQIDELKEHIEKENDEIKKQMLQNKLANYDKIGGILKAIKSDT